MLSASSGIWKTLLAEETETIFATVNSVSGSCGRTTAVASVGGCSDGGGLRKSLTVVMVLFSSVVAAMVAVAPVVAALGAPTIEGLSDRSIGE